MAIYCDFYKIEGWRRIQAGSEFCLLFKKKQKLCCDSCEKLQRAQAADLKSSRQPDLEAFSNPAFAEALRATRWERGLTQRQLAKILNISRSTLASWEQGCRRPSKEFLPEVARVLSWKLNGSSQDS